MAYTTINKSTAHFNTKLYNGTGNSNALTGVGFKPDWTWIKQRNGTSDNCLFDSVRGVTKRITSNGSNAEDTLSNSLTAFGNDGFTVGSDTRVNGAGGTGGTYVAWNWKAGTSFSNSAGANGASIASTGSINTAAGFSIIKYTGNGSTATVGHGLGVAPKVIMVKNRDAGVNWLVYHDSIAATKTLILNTTAGAASDAAWNNTDPTSSVFSIGNTGSGNGSGQDLIAYCFAEKTGYSKFGTYKGNNNANGTFVYTGFSPAFIIIKKTSASGNGWQLRDNKRTPYGNETKNLMYASANSAEQTTDGFDFLSNGFKWRNQAGDCNGNGDYIYMAFAKAPLVGTNNVPATAR